MREILGAVTPVFSILSIVWSFGSSPALALSYAEPVYLESISGFELHVEGADPDVSERLVIDETRPAGEAIAVADTSTNTNLATWIAESKVFLLGFQASSHIDGSAHASTQLEFGVEGPATADLIPVLLHAVVQLEVSGNSIASESNVFLTYPGGEIRFDACDASGCTNFGDTFIGTIPLLLPANEVLAMALGSNLAAQVDGTRVHNMNGVVRAVLEIDPAFPQHDQYSIVPEPATLVLLGSGIAALVVAGRSRRA